MESCHTGEKGGHRDTPLGAVTHTVNNAASALGSLLSSTPPLLNDRV